MTKTSRKQHKCAKKCFIVVCVSKHNILPDVKYYFYDYCMGSDVFDKKLLLRRVQIDFNQDVYHLENAMI